MANTVEFWSKALWKIFVITCFILIMIRFDHMEAEHNAIIDRLDQVENTVIEQLQNTGTTKEALPDSSFKSWMSFQSNNG